MLVSSALGLRYMRVLTEDMNSEDLERLKQTSWYLFLVSYQPIKSLKGFRIDEKNAVIIDLTTPLESIFQKFKSNTRKEIRHIERNPDVSFRRLDPNIDEVFQCYANFEKLRGWRPALKEEIRNSLIFSASRGGKVIAGITCYHHRNLLRVGKIFSERLSSNDETLDSALIGQATRKLVWEICQYGKENNFKMLDLAGVDFSDPVKVGITRFKQSFGGEVQTVYVCRQQRPLFSIIKKTLGLFGRDIT